MIRVFLKRMVCIYVAAWFLQAVPVSAGLQDRPAEPAPLLLNSAVFLMRDPAVQSELALTDSQIRSVDGLAAELNEPLWQLRDVPAGAGGEGVRQLNEALEQKLQKILTPAQQQRMDEIVLQGYGPPALIQARVAQKLQLTPEQHAQVIRLFRGTREAVQELRAKVTPETMRVLNEAAQQLLAEEREQILAVLSESQRSQWQNLLGKPFDRTRLAPMFAQAPEIRGIDAWINTPPLTLESLRGKVVALHFWTFG